MERIDAVVVGAGPNGLSAAVTLAEAGLAVRGYEPAPAVGGGAPTEPLTLPGFRHDPCSAVHPLGAGSPVFRSLPLERYGFEWVEPDIPLAHPLGDGRVAVLGHSSGETAASLGAAGDRYGRMMTPFVGRWDSLAADVLGPLLRWPRDPVTAARFGTLAALPVALLAAPLRDERARALLAGLAAHAVAPLTSPAAGGGAVRVAPAGRAGGWACARGGSHSLSAALARHLASLGGEIVTRARVASLDTLPRARAYPLDVSV